MSALNSRISRLEANHGPQVLGRWILLGGDPRPDDETVNAFLSEQGIVRQRTDFVWTGHDEAAPGTPLSLVEVIPVTQTVEEMLAELDSAA